VDQLQEKLLIAEADMTQMNGVCVFVCVQEREREKRGGGCLKSICVECVRVYVQNVCVESKCVVFVS
jgi:hypothetical protein